MWEHYCKVEKTLIEIGDGEECNWCGLTESMLNEKTDLPHFKEG